MEKWRSKGKTIPNTESLLPPTRRQQQQDIDSSLIEKRKGKRWTIGGFLKRISHRDNEASTSSDTSILNTPVIRRKKVKNQQKNKISRRAIHSSSLQTKKDLDFTYSSGKSLEINPFIFPIVESLSQQEFIINNNSRSDCSLDGSTKKIRKDKIKARIEAKRDKLCTNSSTDESSNESKLQNGYKNDVSLRRRRHARAERLMKSLCRENSGNSPSSASLIDYQLKIQETKNPLVKQTFQYFSDFDRRNINKYYEDDRKRPDVRRTQTQEIFPISDNCLPQKSKSQEDIYINPVLKSTVDDSHYKRSRIQPNYQNLQNGANSPLVNYKQSPRNYQQGVINHHEGNYSKSSDQFDNRGIYSRIRSPLEKGDNSWMRKRSSPGESLPNGDFNGKCEKTDVERRSSKNLEEALCELEEIYNSLQLGDEDLLERAERRSMEEYSKKKMENTLNNLEEENSSKLEIEPNILRDDMAYRRLRSSSSTSNRPTSDSHALLSNISYLITSPIASRRDHYPNVRANLRNKEPDITFDDVVFRNLHHANNSLKVIQPQPPFGIPLGPITAATESDYLHSKPSKSNNSPQSCEPNIVTDDLAFRNLRKDRSIDQKTVNFLVKKKRAVRSLSANFYTLINNSNRSDENVNLDINGNQSDDFDKSEGRTSIRFDYDRNGKKLQKIPDVNYSKEKQEICQMDQIDNLLEKFDNLGQEEEWKKMENSEFRQNCDKSGKSENLVNIQSGEKILHLSSNTIQNSDDESKFPREIQDLSSNRKEALNRIVDKIEDPIFDEIEDPIIDEIEDPIINEVEDSIFDKVNDENPRIKIEIEEKTSKHLGPFTEHEISIYRQLCQELENLVDSTSTHESSIVNNDETDDKNCESGNQFSKSNAKQQNLTTNEIDEIGNEITCLREKLTNFVSTKEINGRSINDTSDIKQESKNQANNNDEKTNLLLLNSNKNDDDDDEMPHCSRTIFQSGDATTSCCEGENKSCKEASNVCNAELLLLTVKNVCYVTNQMKAHFFLLLALFFVLLIAITTM